MGRLWQTLILMQKYPVFEYLPVESLIKENQNNYYKALGASDKLGESTPFVEFMLTLILQALNNLLASQNVNLTAPDRIELFKDFIGLKSFSRKDYLLSYKLISQATASRDLKWAVDNQLLEKLGDKRNTKYKYKTNYNL